MNLQNQFTGREIEAIKLLLLGRSNKQIALALGVSDRTVEFHLSNIYAKLGVNSRTEAALKLSETYLGESTGNPTSSGELRESTVEKSGAFSENASNSISLQRKSANKKLHLANNLEAHNMFDHKFIGWFSRVLLVLATAFLILIPFTPALEKYVPINAYAMLIVSIVLALTAFFLGLYSFKNSPGQVEADLEAHNKFDKSTGWSALVLFVLATALLILLILTPVPETYVPINPKLMIFMSGILDLVAIVLGTYSFRTSPGKVGAIGGLIMFTAVVLLLLGWQ